MSAPPPRGGVPKPGEPPRGHSLLAIPGRPGAPAPQPAPPPANPPRPLAGGPSAPQTQARPAPPPAPTVGGNRLPMPSGGTPAARPGLPAPAPASPAAPGAGPASPAQAQAAAQAAQAAQLGPRPSEPRIVIGINDLKSARVTGTLVTIGLGSCIGVCVHDAVSRTGALCHYMLPDGSIDAKRANLEPLMFGDRAVAQLVDAFRKLGGRLENALVYIAGGASMNPGSDIFDIGTRNTTIARDTLARLGLKVTRAEVGGRISRTLALDVQTGLVTVSTPGLQLRRLS